MINSIKQKLIDFCNERDELLMKQQYGDKPGQYRPRTYNEVKSDNPGADEETVGYLYEGELEFWGLKDPDPIIISKST